MTSASRSTRFTTGGTHAKIHNPTHRPHRSGGRHPGLCLRQRPAGFEFTAGQYLTLTLHDPLVHRREGQQPHLLYRFAAPQTANWLVCATRMTGSALKRSLAEAPLGTPVSIFGPAGDFTLGPDPTPVVFIAGGIGITPFRSMLLDARGALTVVPGITLIYSNRTPEGWQYDEELAGLARSHVAVRYVPTMVEPDKSAQPWNGERRFVNAEILRDYVGDMTVSIFHLAGPPGLVVAATKTVLEAGAAPAHVLSEEFSGYESRPIGAVPAQTAVSAANFIKVAQQGAVSSPGKWRKTALWGRSLDDVPTGTVLFVDLDSIITGPLDDFFTIGRPATCISPGTGPSPFSGWDRPRYSGSPWVPIPICWKISGGIPSTSPRHADSSSTTLRGTSRAGVKFWPTTWVRHFRLHCLGVWPLRYVRPQCFPAGEDRHVSRRQLRSADACAGHMTGFEKPGKPLVHLRQTMLSDLPFKEKYDRIKNYMLPVPWAVEHGASDSPADLVRWNRASRFHESSQRPTHHLHEVGHPVRPRVCGSALLDGSPPFDGRVPVHLFDG